MLCETDTVALAIATCGDFGSRTGGVEVSVGVVFDSSAFSRTKQGASRPRPRISLRSAAEPAMLWMHSSQTSNRRAVVSGLPCCHTHNGQF